MRQKINISTGGGSGGGVVNIYNNTYELSGNVEMISLDATENQVVFTLPFSYTPGASQLFVYSAGLIQAPASDYTETDITTITFATDRTAGEKIIISKIKIADTTEYTLVVNNDYTTMYVTNDYTTVQVDYSTFVINDYTNVYNDYSTFVMNDYTNIYEDHSHFIFNDYTTVNQSTYELAGNMAMASFDVTSDQSVFELPITYTPGSNQLQVYVNGLLIAPSAYTEVDSTTIEFDSDKTSGDVVIVSRIQVADTTEYTINVFNDYTSVYNDQTTLIVNDYSTFDFTTVVVNEVTNVTNDFSNFITNEFVNQYSTENVFNDYSVAGQVLSYSVDATEGQTTFIIPFQYVLHQNELEVHSSGMLMHCGSDFTEVDSTRIRFIEPRMDGEKIVVTRIGISGPLDFTSGVIWNPVTITSDYTANSYDRIFANSTDDTFTITFPSNPSVNHEIEIICVADSFEVNAVELDPNGKKILGNSSFTLDSNASVQFVYSGETYGWVLR